MLWRHVRVDDDHRVFVFGGCNVVQERKFVAKFMAAVSSNSILIAAVWRQA